MNKPPLINSYKTGYVSVGIGSLENGHTERMDSVRSAINQLKFPATRAVLWDHRHVGPSAPIHINHYRNPVVVIEEKTLRLVHRFSQEVHSNSYKCHLVGSLTVDPDGCGVVITVDRLDTSRGADVEKTSLTQLTPGQISIPCVVQKNGAKPSNTTDNFENAISLLSERCTSKSRIDLSHFMAIRANCSYHGNKQTYIFHIDFDLMTSVTGFKATPVNPVPIVPSALSKNLSGPMNMSDVQGEPKSGYLTMDHTRKVLLVLESDPKVASLPVIGIWISGVSNIQDPLVWVSCLRYLYNVSLKERICVPPEPFLIILYSPLRSKPEFYDCVPTNDSKELEFSLSSCHEVIQLPKDGLGRATSPLELEMVAVETGDKMARFEAALQNTQTTRTLSKVSSPMKSDLSGSAEDITPRRKPAPHQMKAPTVKPSVPEVSLLFDEQSLMLSHSDDSHASPRMSDGGATGPQRLHPTTINQGPLAKSPQQGPRYHNPAFREGPNQPLQSHAPRPHLQQPQQSQAPQPYAHNPQPYPQPQYQQYPPQYVTGPADYTSPSYGYLPQPASRPYGPCPPPYTNQYSPHSTQPQPYMPGPRPRGPPHQGPPPHRPPTQGPPTQGPPIQGLPRSVRGPPPSMGRSQPPQGYPRGPPARPQQQPTQGLPALGQHPGMSHGIMPGSKGQGHHIQGPQHQLNRQEGYPSNQEVTTSQVPSRQLASHYKPNQPLMNTQSPTVSSNHGTPQSVSDVRQKPAVIAPTSSQGLPQASSGDHTSQTSPGHTSTDSGLHSNDSADSGGALDQSSYSTVPAEVYDRLRAQDEQLRTLQDQLAALLAKQASGSPLTPTNAQTPTNKPQDTPTNKCEAAINTSLFWPNAESTFDQSSSQVHCVLNATDLVNTSSMTTSSHGNNDVSGTEHVVHINTSAHRDHHGKLHAPSFPNGQVRHPHHHSNQEYQPQQQNHNQRYEDEDHRRVGNHGDPSSAAPFPSPVRSDQPDSDGPPATMSNDTLSLGEFQLTTLTDRSTEDSIMSEMVVDMPAYSSLSPEKLGGGSSSGFGDTDDSNRSPVLGESVSMYEQGYAGQLPEGLHEAGLHVNNQQMFYKNLIGNVQKLLEKHSTTEGDSTAEDTDGYHGDLESPEDLGGNRGDCVGDHGDCAGNHGHTESEERPEKSINIAEFTLKRLREIGADVDPSSSNTSRYFSDNQSMFLDPALLPTISYMSMMFDSAGESDLSHDADALAMKYLSDEQLSALARQRLHSPRKQRTRDAGLHRVMADRPADLSTYGPSNHMSFASRKYLDEYGLGDGEDETKAEHPRTESRRKKAENSESLETLGSHPALANVQEYLRKLNERSFSVDGSVCSQPSFDRMGSHCSSESSVPATHYSDESYLANGKTRGVAGHRGASDHGTPQRKGRVWVDSKDEHELNNTDIGDMSDRVLDIERLKQLPKLL